MDRITLYGFGNNDRSGKVRWTAHALGLEVEEVRLQLGEQKGPEYLEHKNFLGVIPTTVWKGETLIESTATCVYLAERYPEKGLVPALDAPERYAFLKWLSVFSENMEAPLVTSLVSRFMREDEGPFDFFRPQLEPRLQAIASQLPTQGFLAGASFTVADIVAGYNLRLAIQLGLLSMEQVFPYFSALLAREDAVASRIFSSLRL